MEGRSIKISLDKAREWYNQGGELKEIALRAFTEKKITECALPKTWKEFCEMYHIKPDDYRNVLPSQQAAKAHLAYMKLHYLRDCYRQGWVPDWSNSKQWCIMFDTDTFIVQTGIYYNRFLSFQSQKIAEKFLNNFKGLIETAGDLI